MRNRETYYPWLIPAAAILLGLLDVWLNPL